MKKTYKAKVTIRSKGKFCFHVPKKLVDDKKLLLNKDYDITIDEVLQS